MTHSSKVSTSPPENSASLSNGSSSTSSVHSAKDTLHSIMRSTLQFLSGTALSRVTGMVRDIILAFSFGTHEALAALFVAFRLSHVCRRLFGEGALQSAFIPLFEEVRTESEKKAFTFFKDMTALWTIFLALFTGCSISLLILARSYYTFSCGTDEILYFMIILMPSLLPICLFGLNSSLLQCEKKYFTVGIAPTFFNISIAATAAIFSSTEPRQAMPYIALSIVVGCFFQWISTFIPAWRCTEKILGKGSFFKNIRFFSDDIRRLWGPLALGLIGVGASQINNAIDALFARVADPEGPAQLWFGLRLQQLPLALFGIALSGAILPPLSRAIQANNRYQYIHFLEFAIRRVIALLAPCTAFLLVVGMASITCLYGRGDFQNHSIIMTTGCLHGYAIALIPMGIIIVLAPAFYAKKNYAVPTKGAIISLVCNAVLNAFFVFIMGWKAISVALATSISSWVNAIYLYRKLTFDFGPILTARGKKACFTILFVVAITTICTWICITCLYGAPVFFSFFSEDRTYLLPTGLVDQVLFFAIPSIIFFLVLIGSSLAMKATDITHIFKTKEESVQEEKDILAEIS